ncbi:MAG: YybH family protein [Actinomycetota bacterium]
MDRARVARWLKIYVEAWETYDRDKIADLFSEDATYRYHPYDEPVRGRDAIVRSWLEEPDATGTYEATYEPIVVEGDVAVAVGNSVYRGADGTIEKTYDNCFVMRFDDDGRCRDFTEWYMKRPT